MVTLGPGREREMTVLKRWVPKYRLNTSIQVGNLLNASDTTQLTTAYGANWLKPITCRGSAT